MFEFYEGKSREEVMGIMELYKDLNIIDYLMKKNLESEAQDLLDEVNNLIHNMGFPNTEFNMKEILELKTLVNEQIMKELSDLFKLN